MTGLDKLNKRGSIIDLIIIVIFVLFFAVFALIGFKLSSEFDTKIQSMEVFPNASKDISSDMKNQYTTTVDGLFLMFIVGLSIGAFVLAALVRVHPIFLVGFVLVWFVLLFFSGVVSNIYQELAGNSELITEANQLVIISHGMIWLPYIVGVISIILMIVIYKTWDVG